jgi:hypothetical protein
MSTKTKQQNALRSNTTLDGQMTFSKNDNGLNLMDFASTEQVRMEAFTATCKVQVMRDGFVYITEKKRRKRNKPIFREDHSSLSLGHDGKYYFYFAMPAEQAGLLPDQLVSEALAIAQKMANALLNAMEEEA